MESLVRIGSIGFDIGRFCPRLDRFEIESGGLMVALRIMKAFFVIFLNLTSFFFQKLRSFDFCTLLALLLETCFFTSLVINSVYFDRSKSCTFFNSSSHA
jgi:hypothetical protein